MKHIKTLTTRNLKESMKKGGCGECQTSCQSACKQRVTSLLIMRSGDKLPLAISARRAIFFTERKSFSDTSV